MASSHVYSVNFSIYDYLSFNLVKIYLLNIFPYLYELDI